jgi:phosphoglycolate phosphatase
MIADAVLFDLDGVLVDSRAAFARSVNAALAGHGLAERADDELYRYLGPPLHRTFATLAPELGEVDLDGLVLSYRARYRDTMVGESALYPGIAEVLAELSATMPLVVATSKAQALAAPLLEGLGVGQYFEAIVGPSLQARDEAKSLTIGRALARLPHARRPVMVGDRKFDVLGARAHEMPCVGVLWGIGSEQELRDAGAAALAREPAELTALAGA